MKNNKPLVSIVTATRNRSELLTELIESLLAQTYQNWELVIVDNASDDGTNSLITSYQIKYPEHIQYLRQEENLGFTKGVYTGLEIAEGEILGFLGDDDMLLPHWLSLAVSTLEKHANLGLVYGNVWIGRKLGKETHFPAAYKGYKNRTLNLQEYAKMMQFKGISTIGTLFTKEAYEKIGKLDTRYITDTLQDTDLWRRISASCPIFYVEDIVGFSRVHGENMTHVRRKEFLAASVDYWLDIARDADPQEQKEIHKYIAKRLLDGARSYCNRETFSPKYIREFARQAWRYNKTKALTYAYLVASILPQPAISLAIKAKRKMVSLIKPGQTTIK